jgi:hypothetical protein
MQKSSERRGRVREEEEDGKEKSQTSTRQAFLKGAGVTPHLQRRTHRVSETFARLRACPDKTTAHSCDASIPAEYGLAESAHSHDGAVTSVTSTEMPVPITAPAFTTTAITALTKHPQATTATITNKSSRVSLQLTHELGGYIQRMRSRAPTENVKNTNNTKNHPTEPERDSLTPSQARGLLTRARIRAPFDGKILPLRQQDIPTPLTM